MQHFCSTEGLLVYLFFDMAPVGKQESLAEPASKKPRTAETLETAASGAERPQVQVASAASGAAAQAEAAPTPTSLSITDLLEMDSNHDGFIATWAANTKAQVDKQLLTFLQKHHQKVAFEVPTSVLLIPPLEITSAASDSQLKSFREVMNYDNMMLSFSKSGQYEAAGTVWMLDPIAAADAKTSISITQLESAMALWSESALLQSSTQAAGRR